jgi:hypothetical protein
MEKHLPFPHMLIEETFQKKNADLRDMISYLKKQTKA